MDVLLVCPQERDFVAIEAAGLESRYRIHPVGADLDRADAFDPDELIAAADRLPADGVLGTKDRSALLAALVAERRGLPGPSPAAVLACQHKPTSRALQRQAVPEATPGFATLADPPPFEPPLFVKPVVGRLSQGAFRVDSPGDLDTLPDLDEYASGYARLAVLAGLRPGDVRGFLAEELLEGEEVTYEGYAYGGRVVTVGITDSRKYEGTSSFERFELPTALSRERQDEIAGIAARLMPALGFDGGLFNVEFFVPAEGPVKIVEVNARMASQFSPLGRAVYGRSAYEAAFQLACGRDPGWKPVEPHGVALSYCLRRFEDALVTRVPPPAVDLEVLVSPGRRLSEQGVNDPRSFRLCLVTVWAQTRERALEEARARAAALDFGLEPL